MPVYSICKLQNYGDSKHNGTFQGNRSWMLSTAEGWQKRDLFGDETVVFPNCGGHCLNLIQLLRNTYPQTPFLDATRAFDKFGKHF